MLEKKMQRDKQAHQKTPNKRNASREHEPINIGKIPPQAIDLEEAILGAVMLEKNSMLKVADRIRPEFFYKDANIELYSAIQDLYLNRQPIDILTVTEKLKSLGKLEIVGGPYYITKLTNRVSSAANLEYHSMIMIEKYLLRELISLSGELINESYEDGCNVFEVLDFAFSQLFALHSIILGVGGNKTWPEIIAKTLADIEERGKNEHKLSGLNTGNRKLNHYTGGWQPGNLIIMAARPGMGKTARVLNFLKAAAADGKKVQLFSLEMSSMELAKRMISEEGTIPGDFLKSGKLPDEDWIRITQAANKLVELGINIIDRPYMGYNDVQTLARMEKVKHGLDLICIDYLQIMKVMDGKGKTRDVQIGEITGQLKQLAKELDVPVILLCQLSREVERRPDKRPILSDLRESGNIEQDADMVLALYRPAYYFSHDAYSDDYFGSMSQEEFDAHSEIIILKQRGGDSGITVPEKFFGQYSRFADSMEEGNWGEATLQQNLDF